LTAVTASGIAFPVAIFAVPASALSIVFETILARLVLKERVDARRWWGVCLVAFGVGLLAQ